MYTVDAHEYAVDTDSDYAPDYPQSGVSPTAKGRKTRRKPPVPTFEELRDERPAKKVKSKLANNVYSVTCMPNAYP